VAETIATDTLARPQLGRRQGLWLIALAAALWGTVGVTTQAIYHLTATNPLSIGFWRLALATPPLVLAAWSQFGRRAFALARRDLLLTLLIGAMLGLYQACYFAAIARTGVAVATLVTLCTAPVLVALLSGALTREWPTRATLLALACALAGTMLLVVGRPQSNSGTSLLGVLLALGSATGYAIVTLCGRAVAGRAHPLQVNALAFAAGAALLFALALPTGFVVAYPATGWLALLYLGLVPTALAYGLFLVGMRAVPATVASIITLIEPLAATILARLLFGEQLGPGGLVGAVLLLGALVLLYRRA
jgi:DME family drug/metabolite transporter